MKRARAGHGPLAERLLEVHGLSCVCGLCARYLLAPGLSDPFVDKVIELLRMRGMVARAIVRGKDVSLVCAHPYGLRHGVAFELPGRGSAWAKSSSGQPVTPADVAWSCMVRVRKGKEQTA